MVVPSPRVPAPVRAGQYTGTMFPAEYRHQILIAEHGFLDRSRPIGGTPSHPARPPSDASPGRWKAQVRGDGVAARAGGATGRCLAPLPTKPIAPIAGDTVAALQGGFLGSKPA